MSRWGRTQAPRQIDWEACRLEDGPSLGLRAATRVLVDPRYIIIVTLTNGRLRTRHQRSSPAARSFSSPSSCSTCCSSTGFATGLATPGHAKSSRRRSRRPSSRKCSSTICRRRRRRPNRAAAGGGAAAGHRDRRSGRADASTAITDVTDQARRGAAAAAQRRTAPGPQPEQELPRHRGLLPAGLARWARKAGDGQCLRRAERQALRGADGRRRPPGSARLDEGGGQACQGRALQPGHRGRQARRLHVHSMFTHQVLRLIKLTHMTRALPGFLIDSTRKIWKPHR